MRGFDAIAIESVPVDLELASEFADRVEQYIGTSPAIEDAARTLAEHVRHRVDQRGGEGLFLTENEKMVAAAVLDEWRDRPPILDALYYATSRDTLPQ